MPMPRVRFSVGRMMALVAAVAVALAASRLNRLEFSQAYGRVVLGLIGLSPVLICYLWLRQPPDPSSSVSIEVLIRRFAVILVVGLVSWAMFAW